MALNQCCTENLGKILMSTTATMDACFHYWKKHFLAVLLFQNFMLLSQNLQLVP